MGRQAVFLKEGDFWTIGSGSQTVHLRDSKGLSYLARLLLNPGAEFHVLDLVAAETDLSDETSDSPADSSTKRRAHEDAGLHVGRLGDAGEMLDAQSKAAYRQRLEQLREELGAAKRRDDVESASRAEDEIEALTRELSRAVGLRGRSRRASSSSERARVSVAKAIKHAIEKIAQNEAALANDLARTIQTGTFCSYTPDASNPLDWKLGGNGSSPAGMTASSANGHAPSAAPAEVAVAPIFRAERTTFVGREAEHAQIVAAFRGAIDGHGSIIVLGGGPGVGKTRLAIESARQAANEGALVLFGRCYDDEEPHPYSPFVEMVEMALRQTGDGEGFRRALGENAAELAQMAPRLRQIFPDIPAPMELPPEQARRFLFEGVCSFVERAAQGQPVFLVLDDLQWGDDATLALLLHLARRIAALRVMLVATYRDAEADRTPAFTRTLEELIRGGIRPIRLQGLPQLAVGSMIRALSPMEPPPQLIEAIYQETGGNPFFVEELFKYLQEEGKISEATGSLGAEVRIGEVDVPENIRLVVGRRLDRLTGPTQQALAAAAAIGRSFSFGLLESIAQNAEDVLFNAIEEALKSGLIVSSRDDAEESFNFSHELVRQSVLSRLATPRRRRLHLRVAEAIEKMSAQMLDDRAAEIAHHLVQAGPEAESSKTAHYLMIAGKSALAAAAYEDALHHFEAALHRVSALDSASYAELLSDIGMTERSLRRWDDAREHWRKSFDIYASLGDREAVGRLSVAIVEALGWAGRHLEAAQFAYSALMQLEGSVSGHRARLLGMVGAVHAATGTYKSAADTLAEAVALAEQSGDRRALGEVLGYRSFHNFVFLRVQEALDDGRRSTAILRETGAVWSLAQLLGFLQRALFKAGHLEEAEKVNAELEPLANKLGHDAAKMVYIRGSAWNEFSKKADLNALEGWFKRELEIMQAARMGWTSSTYALFALVEFMRGNWDAALARSEEAYAGEIRDAFNGYGAGMLFRLRAYRGEREAALALLEKRREWLPRADVPSPVGSWGFMTLVVEGLWVLGEHKQAAELEPLARLATESGTRIFLMTSRSPYLVAGIAAAAGENWEGSEEYFQLAIKIARDIPNRPEQPEARRFYAEMLMKRGRSEDRARAHHMLSEALEAYEQMGMRRHAEITRELIAKSA
ncbi:MAG: AAA family ATPase [Candidatus Binataceae bacterium]